MRLKCKCKRCPWEWDSGLPNGPKSCPGCHSTAWRTASNIKKLKVKMVCAICDKKLKEGETAYKFQEGSNINGIFILESEKTQALYCENCCPDEKVLPFAK